MKSFAHRGKYIPHDFGPRASKNLKQALANSVMDENKDTLPEAEAETQGAAGTASLPKEKPARNGETVAIEPTRMPSTKESSTPQTENTEVHKHPKHVTHKKKWTEYLLEFFMLFLAVFLGFVAENIRENSVERHRERDYIINIKKDLAEDITAINIWIPAISRIGNGFDSLMDLLQSPNAASRGSDLYYYARMSTRSRSFVASNNTFTELKNSGNLRLITNKVVVNSLTDSQKLIDNYVNLAAIGSKESKMPYPSLAELFDASVFNRMIIKRAVTGNVNSVDSSLVSDTIAKPPGTPQLFKHDPEAINRFIFYLHERKSSMVGEASLLIQQKENAAALIRLINNEYRLEDE